MSFWRRYVPVAKRRANAQKNLKKLLKNGQEAQPVELEGRTIARSFWGKGWCDHLESFSDYANRLPRGRTYVRNGSVCHLDIQPGRIDALVSGSSLYTLTIQIKELSPGTWTHIKKKCAGQVGSMLELLQGKLSNEVMAIVTDRARGLFPKPGEIELKCDCPDWAVMCKHVAAVLYGVGSRLDTRPDLLFLLRNVDAQELIATELAVPEAEWASTEDVLAPDQLAGIFDIDLDMEPAKIPAAASRRKKPAGPPKPKTSSRNGKNGTTKTAALTAKSSNARQTRAGTKPSKTTAKRKASASVTKRKKARASS